MSYFNPDHFREEIGAVTPRDKQTSKQHSHSVLGKILGLFEQGRERCQLAQFKSIAHFKTTASHGPDMHVFPKSVCKILKGR